MQPLKILFIREDFDDEPLGLMYVTSAFKKAGAITDIVLTKFENYLSYFKKFDPDVIAFSVTSGFENYYLNIIAELKHIKPQVFALFGGPHPTFFPKIINELNLDAIAIGECENQIEKFVCNFFDKEKLYTTKNFYFNNDGNIIKNELDYLTENLDDIDFPDRDIVYKYEFARINPKKSFISGRGCPYKCTYCFNHIFHKIYKDKGKIIRKRSVDSLITEIEHVKNNYPLGFIHYVDDIFIIDKDWLIEYTDKYTDKIGLPYTCNIRPNLVTEDIGKLLKKSNCHSVSLAIESGNDIVRNKYLERNLSNEQIIEACRILKSYGLKVATQNIVGIPGGSLSSDFDTVELNLKCKPDYAWCTIYQPYPGTKLAETAEKLGLFKGDIKNMSNSFHKNSILDIENKMEVTNLHKLFGISAESQMIFKIVKILIKLPLTPLYSIIRKLWNAYCFKFRIMSAVGYKILFIRSFSFVKKRFVK